MAVDPWSKQEEKACEELELYVNPEKTCTSAKKTNVR